MYVRFIDLDLCESCESHYKGVQVNGHSSVSVSLTSVMKGLQCTFLCTFHKSKTTVHKLDILFWLLFNDQVTIFKLFE